MTQIKYFPREFIERTVRLLDELEDAAKDKGLEVTLFTNCLLGMVVSAIENEKKCDQRIFGKRLSDHRIAPLIPKKIKALKINKDYIKELSKEDIDRINQFKFLRNFESTSIQLVNSEIPFMTRDEIMSWKLTWFLRKIRNGISHQNILPVNHHGKWLGLRIWNCYEGVEDFAIEFKINELKAFSKFVVKSYLDSYPEREYDVSCK